ncbi:MAG TPA: hypothetical protein VMU51_27235 [Mycobacteriales bacterium]|nr:hypothetical protein [Mycobacteriales bacterium]
MSSTILMVIVLVVMWLVVLVPMFVRRHEDPSEARPGERIATAVRVLARRTQPAAEVPADPQPAAQPRSAAFRVEAHRRMLRRRRRTLALLAVVAATGTAAAPIVSGWLWPVAGIAATLFASYLIWLRQQVRRQQERWQRRAAVFSRSTPSHPARAADVARPQRRTRRAARRPVTVDTAPAEPAADGTWEPTPVPVPTYVTKAVAPQRTRPDAIVALDDEDPSFAEIEDVVPPLERRRAVNG